MLFFTGFVNGFTLFFPSMAEQQLREDALVREVAEQRLAAEWAPRSWVGRPPTKTSLRDRLARFGRQTHSLTPNYTYHHARVNNGMNSDSRANSASRLLTAPDSLMDERDLA